MKDIDSENSQRDYSSSVKPREWISCVCAFEEDSCKTMECFFSFGLFSLLSLVLTATASYIVDVESNVQREYTHILPALYG